MNPSDGYSFLRNKKEKKKKETERKRRVPAELANDRPNNAVRSNVTANPPEISLLAEGIPSADASRNLLVQQKSLLYARWRWGKAREGTGETMLPSVPGRRRRCAHFLPPPPLSSPWGF